MSSIIIDGVSVHGDGIVISSAVRRVPAFVAGSDVEVITTTAVATTPSLACPATGGPYTLIVCTDNEHDNTPRRPIISVVWNGQSAVLAAKTGHESPAGFTNISELWYLHGAILGASSTVVVTWLADIAQGEVIAYFIEGAASKAPETGTALRTTPGISTASVITRVRDSLLVDSIGDAQGRAGGVQEDGQTLIAEVLSGSLSGLRSSYRATGAVGSYDMSWSMTPDTGRTALVVAAFKGQLL